MRRWLTLLVAAFAGVAPAAEPPCDRVPGSLVADRPAELPPLLPPGPSHPPYLPGGPIPRRPAAGGYDHGQFYLPEAVATGPKLPPCPCRPLGRTWATPTLAMGWSRAGQLPAADGADASFRAGFGLTAGTWLDRCQNLGVEGSFFFLAEGRQRWTAAAPAFGAAAGAGLSTDYWSADVTGRRTLFCEDNVRLDAVGGYRFASLREELTGGGTAGSLAVAARETTANRAHVGELGLGGEYRFDRWYAGMTAVVGLGVVRAESDAVGVAGPAGALAVSRDADRFAVLPTANLTIGRQWSEHGRAFVGYGVHYLSRAARPGTIPAAGAELALTDFWVQTVNLGLEFRY